MRLCLCSRWPCAVDGALKGSWSKGARRPKGLVFIYLTNVKVFLTVSLFCQYLYKRNTFLPRIWARGAATPARSLPMKSRKTLARDASGTIATYSDLVHGVTGTYCCAQNGTTHGRVFATFKRRFVCIYIKTRNQAKKLICVKFLFHSCL